MANYTEKYTDEELECRSRIIMDIIRGLIRGLKKAEDRVLCANWLSFLKDSASGEVRARDSLLEMMMCQLREVGHLSAPFTTHGSCPSDMHLLLDKEGHQRLSRSNAQPEVPSTTSCVRSQSRNEKLQYLDALEKQYRREEQDRWRNESSISALSQEGPALKEIKERRDQERLRDQREADRDFVRNPVSKQPKWQELKEHLDRGLQRAAERHQLAEKQRAEEHQLQGQRLPERQLEIRERPDHRTMAIPRHQTQDEAKVEGMNVESSREVNNLAPVQESRKVVMCEMCRRKAEEEANQGRATGGLDTLDGKRVLEGDKKRMEDEFEMIETREEKNDLQRKPQKQREEEQNSDEYRYDYIYFREEQQFEEPSPKENEDKLLKNDREAEDQATAKDVEEQPLEDWKFRPNNSKMTLRQAHEKFHAMAEEMGQERESQRNQYEKVKRCLTKIKKEKDLLTKKIRERSQEIEGQKLLARAQAASARYDDLVSEYLRKVEENTKQGNILREKCRKELRDTEAALKRPPFAEEDPATATMEDDDTSGVLIQTLQTGNTYTYIPATATCSLHHNRSPRDLIQIPKDQPLRATSSTVSWSSSAEEDDRRYSGEYSTSRGFDYLSESDESVVSYCSLTCRERYPSPSETSQRNEKSLYRWAFSQILKGAHPTESSIILTAQVEAREFVEPRHTFQALINTLIQNLTDVSLELLDDIIQVDAELEARFGNLGEGQGVHNQWEDQFNDIFKRLRERYLVFDLFDDYCDLNPQLNQILRRIDELFRKWKDKWTNSQ